MEKKAAPRARERQPLTQRREAAQRWQGTSSEQSFDPAAFPTATWLQVLPLSRACRLHTRRW